MSRPILAAAVAIVVSVFMFPAAAQELVLGLSYPKTGPYATASNTEVAVDIAVAEVNAAGGVNGKKLRVERFDTASDAKNAQVAVQHFAEGATALAVRLSGRVASIANATD